MTSAVQVAFVESGRPDGRLVILAHPIGTSLSTWEPQLPALEPQFRVVRFDARGHGSSPVPSGPYSMADLGADLAALISSLGGGPASIVGQSLGGMTALWMAENAPELVDRVVCCCITARTASVDAWRERAARVRAAGTASIHELVLDRWGYAKRRPDLARWILDQLDATPDEGYAGACEAIAGMDLEPGLGSIKAPVLVIAGDGDPAAPPAAAAAIAAAIP
ncbi:MAG TPA: alpha/beta hydrolase, partial [Dongiaceae bacterium]|nr:alpha/beta hydrolase [Dongiaceae bacterium]